MVRCKEKEAYVERFMEDGVEVIVNHLEPYIVEGEASNLRLKKEFTIDTEEDDVADTGLADIYNFDIDSAGNLYFLNRSGSGHSIFKFDQKGNFVTSFGYKAQGPGEITNPFYLKADFQDDIVVMDHMKKVLIFSADGELKKEFRSDVNLIQAFPLENGNYLGKKLEIDPNVELRQFPLILFNSDFKKIKELGKYRPPDFQRGQKLGVPFHKLVNSVSNGKIYVGNTEKGYEIRVYDLEGNLIRRIRKEFQQVSFSEAKKREILSLIKNPSEWKQTFFFHKYCPPFQYFFTDDEGHLFVMTYEEGENPGEYQYDIFNSSGIFISRISLENIVRRGQVDRIFAAAKNKCLYCLQEKESGYKELVVYRMIWE
jgi:hypothetical protein